MAKVKSYMLVALSIHLSGKVYRKENEDIFTTEDFPVKVLEDAENGGFLKEVTGVEVEKFLKEKADVKKAEQKHIDEVNAKIAEDRKAVEERRVLAEKEESFPVVEETPAVEKKVAAKKVAKK